MRRIAWVSSLALVVLSTSGYAQEKPKIGVSFEERRLAVIPEDMSLELLRVSPPIFSPDGRNVAVKLNIPNSKCVVLVGDRRSAEFYDVHWQSFRFSPDGKTYAYIQRTSYRSGDKWRMVVGDEQGEEFEPNIGGPNFSPDGKTVWYMASTPSGVFAVVGTKKLGTEFGRTSPLVFSPDGKTFAYSVRDGGVFDPDKSVWVGGKEYLMVGEKKGEDFDQVHSPMFSPDGQSIIYMARKGEKVLCVIGDKKGDEFDQVGRAVYLAEGKTYVYPARSGQKWHVVVGDRKGEELINPYIFQSPDGKTLAYVVQKENRAFMVIGERKSQAFQDVGSPVFSPDGKTVAYIAQNGRKWSVVVGDRRGPEFERVGPPVFSPDGKSLAYGVQDKGKVFVVVDDKKREEGDMLAGPFFSPDNKVVYAVSLGEPGMPGSRQFIEIGDKKWPCVGHFRELAMGDFEKSIIFSRDGKSFAFAFTEGGKECVAVGERKGQAYDRVSRSPTFTADGKTVVYEASDNGRAFVVTGEKKGEEFDQTRLLAWSSDGRAFAYVAHQGQKQRVVLGDKKGEECDQVLTGLTLSPDGRKVAFGARVGRGFWWKVVEAK